MKRNILTTTVIASLTIASALVLSSCQKPATREAKLDPKVASNVKEKSSILEIATGPAAPAPAEGASVMALAAEGGSPETSKPVLKNPERPVYSKDADMELGFKAEANIKNNTLKGTAQDIINKVSVKANKEAIQKQLDEKGAIALVVLNDRIEIYKVVNATTAPLGTDLLSMKYVNILKSTTKAMNSEAMAQANSMLKSLAKASPLMVNQSDAQAIQDGNTLEETFGLVKVTSIAVKGFGVLDNQKNAYGEAKSVLELSKTANLESATHIMLGEEVGSAAASEAEAAAAKAAVEAE